MSEMAAMSGKENRMQNGQAMSETAARTERGLLTEQLRSIVEHAESAVRWAEDLIEPTDESVIDWAAQAVALQNIAGAVYTVQQLAKKKILPAIYPLADHAQRMDMEIARLDKIYKLTTPTAPASPPPSKGLGRRTKAAAA